MIYTFDTKGFLFYPIMKANFHLSDENVYKTIQDGFDILQKQLTLKNIAYDTLKGALIPNQSKDKFETCFIIDSSQMGSSDYGDYVFEKFIPLLDKQSTYSILCGDYIDILHQYSPNSQQQLRCSMNDVLVRCHESTYIHSSQYYLIYVNRLSGSQRLKIVEGLYPYSWFTGFADLTYRSSFKSYISNILMSVGIKSKNKIIMPHPVDYADEKNSNRYGSPFEANGFLPLSINGDSYAAFLSYKIESEVVDKEDVSFSFNALFPKFDSFEKITLNISDNKWKKYLTNKEHGKGHIMELLGYDGDDKVRFRKEIFQQICANYIYNLKKNQYGDLMFNVCMELPTVHGNLRKTTIALKYHPDLGLVDVVTLT